MLSTVCIVTEYVIVGKKLGIVIGCVVSISAGSSVSGVGGEAKLSGGL